MNKHADIIDDRVLGIINDLSTYIDLRKDNRQHASQNNDLGGGNMVMAIALFAAVNLLSKAYIAVMSNEAGEYSDLFDERGYAQDEQKVFVRFVESLNPNIGLFAATSRSKTSYRKVWERFRDFTTHVLVPDQGNIVIAHIWSRPQSKTAYELLRELESDASVFAFQSDNGSWTVNVDKLLSLLPKLTEHTTSFIRTHGKECDKNCSDVLQKILWR